MNHSLTFTRRRFVQTAVGTAVISPVCSSPLFDGGAAQDKAKTRVIGSRVEMFVDDWLVDRQTRVALRLHPPVKREIVLVADKPWEGESSGYYTLFRDGERIRMYYRGAGPWKPDAPWHSCWCYAESTDGVQFTRPNLGLIEYQGSKENNIIILPHKLADGAVDNFAPFLDTNPQACAEERYKALSHGGHPRLFAYASPDGLRWKKMQAEPISSDYIGWDTVNCAFWDETAGVYRSWWRGYDVPGVKDLGAACRAIEQAGGEQAALADDLSIADRKKRDWVRAICSTTSKDFLHWEYPRLNRYPAEAPREQFYTNSVVRCPGAPHILLSFPKRFVPYRTKVMHPPEWGFGVSDAVFMSSRDGLHWDRPFLEAWVRPGRDERNWIQRNNMIHWGILETAPDEFSLYINENVHWPSNRLRRMTVRRHGFASMHAGAARGEFLTKPLAFTGHELAINYSTSAAGSVQVELQGSDGKPLPGFTLGECPEIYGDEIEGVVTWKAGKDVSRFAGKPVRLRFVMKDADVYALRFRP